MRKEQTSHKNEHNTLMCFPLEPVFTRDKRRLPNFIDEATSGLDPVVRDEVTDIFAEFTRDETHSVLLSSHIVSDLEKICDYIAFLHQGKLLLCEEKDILKDTYGMVHCSGSQLSELAMDAVVGKRESAYGVEAMVIRNRIPAGWEVSPVDIEQLFVFMVKGGRAA